MGVSAVLLQLLQQLERREVVLLLQQEVDHAVAQGRPPLLRGAARRLHDRRRVLSDPVVPLHLNRSSPVEETSGGPAAAYGSRAGRISRGRLEAGGIGRKGEPRDVKRCDLEEAPVGV